MWTLPSPSPFLGPRTVSPGALSRIFTAAEITAGSDLPALLERARDASGNEYVFLGGAANVAAGVHVTFDEAGAVTLLAANAIGPVAVALGAVTAGLRGWYQIYGVCTVASTDTIAADKPMFIDGTAGRVDDAVVTGDLVLGEFSMTADTSNVATVFLSYPFVTDALG